MVEQPLPKDCRYVFHILGRIKNSCKANPSPNNGFARYIFIYIRGKHRICTPLNIAYRTLFFISSFSATHIHSIILSIHPTSIKMQKKVDDTFSGIFRKHYMPAFSSSMHYEKWVDGKYFVDFKRILQKGLG